MTKKSNIKVAQSDLIPRVKNAKFQDLKIEPKISRSEAMKKGYILYWNGVDCDQGHQSVRYAKDGVCKKCYQMHRAGLKLSSEVSKDKLPSTKKAEKNLKKAKAA
jgi:hypothetical protein